MNLRELIQAVESAVPAPAAPGTRHRADGRVDTGPQAHQVVIAVRIDPHGRRRETWLCDGVRVEPALLKRLTCAEADCPQARAAQADWHAFLQRRARGQTGSGRPATPGAVDATPGATRLRSGAIEVEARPARFPGVVSCPNHAHPDLRVTLGGLDVFEHGECVVGGALPAGRTAPSGATRPRVRSLAQVQALLDSSHDAAQRAIRAAAGSGA
jgi:hypothetical protein